MAGLLQAPGETTLQRLQRRLHNPLTVTPHALGRGDPQQGAPGSLPKMNMAAETQGRLSAIRMKGRAPNPESRPRSEQTNGMMTSAPARLAMAMGSLTAAVAASLIHLNTGLKSCRQRYSNGGAGAKLKFGQKASAAAPSPACSLAFCDL